MRVNGGGNATTENGTQPILRNEDLPALFWDEMPENIENNPDMAAINAMIEESTPEERVLSFKEHGNRALKTGLKQRKKFYIRQAIEQYTEGLALQCTDAALNSTLFSNRAQANLVLGNFRNALMDGKDAVRYNASNVKGYFRAAKGAIGIGLWETCRTLCNEGLEVEPDNVELKGLLEECSMAQVKREAAKAAEAVRQHELRAPARMVADALLSRGWRLGRPQFRIGDRKPKVESTTGEVRFPVLFFYPEAGMQDDAVEDFGEFDTFEAHLDVMYGPEAPPLEWDSDRRYHRRAIEVYYMSYGAKPMDREGVVEALHGGWPSIEEEGPARYGPSASQWVQVDESLTLGEVLSREDHVVPGVPVFFVLAADSPLRESFLAGEIPLC